ncbi:hypothetical protein HFP51_02885 [Parasphingopyxis sp. CP4]|uniref:hypothetical protein n=1 Tax=Parasphingopyxis sp. CP4 TaxID=2724527 RepID=UPI0015A18B29|nr:hypothetical protein [Parasphingopyxis sp. CP4]QLC21223.1 hypothetical protein HFP51_02885 [Parasphingopyxis sp. CP4]
MGIEPKSVVFAFFAASMVAGCQISPTIKSANITQTDSATHQVTFLVEQEDASRISRGEYYFSFVVIDCEDHSNPYPVEPFVNGRRASEFGYSNPERDVLFTGTIPAHIVSEYRELCGSISGGSYLFGRVDSEITQISRE